MVFRSILPSPHLRPYLSQHLLVHFVFSAHDPIPVKPYPAVPAQGLTFYPRGFLTAHRPGMGPGTRRPQAVVFGQQVSRLDLCLDPSEYLMLEVGFQPGVLAKFLRRPLGEFVDQNVDAEAVLGTEIRLLHEQMAAASNYAQLVGFAEQYIWRRIQRLRLELRPLDHISRLMLHSAASMPLASWAAHACLSISQFERAFRQQVGVSPKLFARVVRFHQACLLKAEQPALDWLSVALHTGYHDYQHLAKDFRQFAGSTPPELLTESALAPEKWLGLV